MPYRNPVIPGFHPDPSLCRVDRDYYCCTSSFCFFPGAPIHHSRDLAHWDLVGNALATTEGYDLDGRSTAHGMWAPTLRHFDDRLWMVTTNMPDRGHLLVHAEDPAGPWSVPVPIAAPGYDCDLFRDEDGSTWFVYADHAAGGIQLQGISLPDGELQGDPRCIFGGWEDSHVEAPHLYRIDGWYYLVCAEGGTFGGHMVTVARSRERAGPYEHCP